MGWKGAKGYLKGKGRGAMVEDVMFWVRLILISEQGENADDSQLLIIVLVFDRLLLIQARPILLREIKAW